MTESAPFKPEHFRRVDDGEDELFYTMPRLVAHIDDGARAALAGYLRQTLREGDTVLDLMASYYSHLPDDLAFAGVTGLGLNLPELEANGQLTAHVVHNLNREPQLPFEDDAFDACLITVSAQYLTRPVDVFHDIARVLRPGAPLIVSYSNRLFPTKAVMIWQAMGDADRSKLLALYFQHAGGFAEPEMTTLCAGAPGTGDPLFVAAARVLPVQSD